MRLNYYTPHKKQKLTLGTRSYYDQTSLIASHQDCVSGIQFFVDNEWYSLSPNFNHFVVNRRQIYGMKIYALELYNKVVYYMKII